MSADASLIGRRIRLLRLNKGLTQTQLARACGVSLNQVVCWEKGHHVASVPRRGRLAEALGVQPEMLFFSAEERAMLFDVVATDVLLSVARKSDATAAQRLTAARGLKLKAAAGAAVDDAPSDFRTLMEQTCIGLDAVRVRLGLEDD